MRTMLATAALAITLPLAAVPATFTAVAEPTTGAEPRTTTLRSDGTDDGEHNFIVLGVSPDPKEAITVARNLAEQDLRGYEEEFGAECTVVGRQESLHKQLKVYLGVVDIVARCVDR